MPEDQALLGVHGDTQVPSGAMDLAVNVLPGPPSWLRERLVVALGDLAAYPTRAATMQAREALAAGHGRPGDECLLLHGAAEGMWLLPQVLKPRLVACVHPSFTEPERAFRAAGVPVRRVLRHPEDQWRIDPARVPDEADVVVLGRPDNPTSVVDTEDVVAGLCRPGRTVIVDEAFADFLPEGADLAGRRDLQGLVVLRSLTKLWGLAGLRVGYLLAAPGLVASVEAARQPWPLSSLTLAAATACAGADAERDRLVTTVAEQRDHLVAALDTLPGVEVWSGPTNFVLVRTPIADLRERLLEHGLAVRRADTFPGLDSTYARIAVRDAATTAQLIRALDGILLACDSPSTTS